MARIQIAVIITGLMSLQNRTSAQTAAQRWIWRYDMTREEAIRILDPETTGEALAEIEYYNGFSGKTAAVQAVSDACILAVASLREQEERRWVPVKERLPEKNNQWVLCLCVSGAIEVGKLGHKRQGIHPPTHHYPAVFHGIKSHASLVTSKSIFAPQNGQYLSLSQLVLHSVSLQDEHCHSVSPQA